MLIRVPTSPGFACGRTSSPVGRAGVPVWQVWGVWQCCAHHDGSPHRGMERVTLQGCHHQGKSISSWNNKNKHCGYLFFLGCDIIQWWSIYLYLSSFTIFKRATFIFTHYLCSVWNVILQKKLLHVNNFSFFVFRLPTLSCIIKPSSFTWTTNPCY